MQPATNLVFRMGPTDLLRCIAQAMDRKKNHGQMVKKYTYQIPAPGCVSDLICT